MAAQPQDLPDAIFERAAHRAREMGLPYAGAVTPTEAHALQQAAAARIVDVRTPMEYQQVGHVEGTPLIEWPRGGDGHAVAGFVERIRHELDPAVPVLFLCRTGVRSHYAAHVAAQAGFAKAFNVLEGFEGQAGTATGWRGAGLPWKGG